MKLNESTYTLNGSDKLTRKFLLASFVGILLSYIGYEHDPKFYHSYLVCYLFFTTLTLGGLFFVLAHHIFGADWSISIRRFGENLMVILPLMLFLSAPIVLNFDHLYEWADPMPHHDHKKHHGHDSVKKLENESTVKENHYHNDNHEESHNHDKVVSENKDASMDNDIHKKDHFTFNCFVKHF